MKKIIIMLFVAALVSGCAFTRTETPITYDPSLTSDADLAGKLFATLEVGDIKDDREIADPTIIFQKRNAYGKTTGSYAAQKPVCEILREGIIDALRETNFNVVDEDGFYILHGEMIEFDYDVVAGWMSVTMLPKMTIKFDLINSKTGKLIWKDAIFGKGKVKTSMVMGESEMVKKSFTSVTDDVINELISDRSFQDALRE